MTVSKWVTLVRQCLQQRISVGEFGEFLHSYGDGIDGKRLFNALIECRRSFCAPGDPLISLYVDYVGTAGMVKVSDALLVLISKWNEMKTPPTQPVLGCYNQTLQDITMIIVSARYKTNASEVCTSLLLSSRWLSSLARHLSQQLGDSANPEHSPVIEALAFLVVSLAATDGGLEALSPANISKGDPKKGSGRELRTSLRQAMEHCLPLYPVLSTQLMERVNAVLKHINLLDDGSSQPANSSTQSSEIQALQFQVSIPDSQIVASKPGTLIYLENMLSTGSTIDDGIVVNFLSSRHQNDYQAMFIDLFTSSFRILKTQNTAPKMQLLHQQCQTFAQNKLPVLLSMISASSFNSFNTEQAITDAWHQVMPSNQGLLMTGFRFLHICSLHHLLTPHGATRLIGSEDLVANMSKGLFAKDDLVLQVSSNHTRGPKLVEELIRSDGSAGSISQALVEASSRIMHNYCQSKETQYLKDLANSILRRPATINFISLFIRPSYWLGPLCTLLDDWRWDEIHEGEAQPVYDDFGAVFLLILVSKARLGLTKSDIGIRKKDGFLAEYLERDNSEESLENLSEERKTHLGNWINALYLAEGLSDELFTNCSPHDFYPLIPTLLRQSIAANQQGKLTQDSLKAGLDYLMEPFLLPSLISALNWVGKLILEDPVSAKVVLEVLVKPPGGTDSQDIHQTILAMCAPQLRKRIECIQHQDDKFESIIKTLNQCPEFSLSVEAEAHIRDKGLFSGLQNSIVTMITSASALEIDEQLIVQNVSSMVHHAIELRGADATLRALIGVLLQLSDSHDFLFALDTVSTIVCVAGHRVRDVLRSQYNNLSPLLKKGETLLAEAIVRLHRQVEAYTNVLTVQDMGLDAFSFAQQLTNIDTANPNLDDNTAVSGGLDMQTEQVQADGIDQVLDEVAAMGNLDSNDADMSFDAFYGLHSTDMDLNDLDLDMF
ncbi:uncharacterized protein Z518_10255 [Rhinocladiella mackenziei CBS 650.93]|uniref:Mediator of RNA polymerase II transcription subunit 5 n=1 Tax=Rhinocladiella mackenziei CBS 650.93 TaxID=1442369 RepID=A0A0D2GP52_9EURO|nr:uncharacterized protein Z518_10255 [Rhinocladiella mackenziei CBS 650.93]KIX00118.1 hypothetical protein Z518_10255 [Rhinocladiella mackenziei CBS 650.93]